MIPETGDMRGLRRIHSMLQPLVSCALVWIITAAPAQAQWEKCEFGNILAIYDFESGIMHEGRELVYAAAGVPTNDGGGVWASSDSGKSWYNADSWINSKQYGIASQLTDSTTYIYLAGASEMNKADVADSFFEKVIHNYIYIGLYRDIAIRGEIIVVPTFRYGLIFSFDRGEHWKNIPEYPAPGLPGRLVHTVAMLESDEGAVTIYAGNGESPHVYCSSDTAATWTKCTRIHPHFVAVLSLDACIGDDGTQYLFAGLVDKGLYRSTDNGATWEYKTPPDILSGANVNDIEAYNDGSVFLSTSNGFYYSPDYGDSWVGYKYEGRTFNAYSATQCGGYVIVSAAGEGIFRRPLSEFQTVGLADPPAPAAMQLYQSYPNPVSSSSGSKIVQIDYELADSGPVRLNVCNVLGTSRVLLEEGVKSSGKHTTHFDTSGLPPGVYLYRLVAGERSLQRKMLIIP